MLEVNILHTIFQKKKVLSLQLFMFTGASEGLRTMEDSFHGQK